MKQIKRMTYILALLACVATVLTGCGAGDAGMGGPSSNASVESIR